MESEPTLSPPQSMAVAYAPRELRSGLSILLEFDNRLKAIATKVQEPVLKQLRLAWWREQLAKASEDRTRGEPLLARLAEIDMQDALIPLLHRLVDAWEILVTIGEGSEQSGMLESNRMRADAVFTGYAKIAGSDSARIDEARRSGLIWAQASLGIAPARGSLRLIPGMKSLNLLLLATDIENHNGGITRVGKILRLNWHALTGL